MCSLWLDVTSTWLDLTAAVMMMLPPGEWFRKTIRYWRTCTLYQHTRIQVTLTHVYKVHWVCRVLLGSSRHHTDTTPRQRRQCCCRVDTIHTGHYLLTIYTSQLDNLRTSAAGMCIHYQYRTQHVEWQVYNCSKHDITEWIASQFCSDNSMYQYF